jgi:hypothetical protein
MVAVIATLLAALSAVVAIGVPPLAGPVTSAHAAAGSTRHGNFIGRVDIGGRRQLYLRCAGRGAPTVILESGIHDSSDVWTLSDPKPPVVGSPSVFSGVARSRMSACTTGLGRSGTRAPRR